MAITKYYNIHEIVTASITADDSVLREIDLHLNSFSVPRLNAKPDIIIDFFNKAPSPLRSTVVDDYDYGSGVIHRKSARFWMNLQSDQQLYCMDKLSLPINLIIQFALLKKGFTFVHGAAISYSGKAILMPAYPGTGKTTLISAFFNVGAKIFGDDLCIVGNGRLYSYPQAFSIYPHHLAVLPYKDRRAEVLFNRTKYIDCMRSLLINYNFRIIKIIRFVLGQLRTESVNVMPEVIFGEGAIARDADLNRVVVLERSGEISTLVEEAVDISVISRQAAAILWHEWHGSFHEILLYDAMAQSGSFFISLFDSVYNIINKSFEGVNCSRVKIPASWDNKKLINEFPAFLIKI